MRLFDIFPDINFSVVEGSNDALIAADRNVVAAKRQKMTAEIKKLADRSNDKKKALSAISGNQNGHK